MNCKEGFSTINNRPPNSNKSSIALTTNIEREQDNNIYQYGIFSFGSNQERLETMEEGQPLYMYLNLLDGIAFNKTLVFNRMRIYIANFLAANDVIIEAGVFQLEPTATFGDFTTYQNNSKLIGTISEPRYITNTDGPKNDGLGFFDIKWKKDVELPICIDKIEQKYFLTLFMRSGSNIQLLAKNTNFNIADLENYAYFDINNTTIIFPNTMGLPGNPPGFYPYFTLFKSIHN